VIDPRSDAYEKARSEQARAWLRTSYRQRLDWLEQAKRFAAKALGAAKRRRRGKGSSEA